MNPVQWCPTVAESRARHPAASREQRTPARCVPCLMCPAPKMCRGVQRVLNHAQKVPWSPVSNRPCPRTAWYERREVKRKSKTSCKGSKTSNTGDYVTYLSWRGANVYPRTRNTRSNAGFPVQEEVGMGCVYGPERAVTVDRRPIRLPASQR